MEIEATLRRALLTGLLTVLVGFPLVLFGFMFIGIASPHGDGLPQTLGADLVLGVIVAYCCLKSRVFAKVVPVILLLLLAAMVLQFLLTTHHY